jgi:hypothetical protein
VEEECSELGFGPGGDWEDMSRIIKNASYIQQLARQWRRSSMSSCNVDSDMDGRRETKVGSLEVRCREQVR